MNKPHERLTRSTFSLPLGEVHALVGGAVNARPLLFLHGFPDHPATAVPFLEHLADTHRVVGPWLRGYAPSPIVGPYDLDTLAPDALALIDPLGGQVDLVGHDWGGMITYTVCAADLHLAVEDPTEIRTSERVFPRSVRLSGSVLPGHFWRPLDPARHPRRLLWTHPVQRIRGLVRRYSHE